MRTYSHIVQTRWGNLRIMSKYSYSIGLIVAAVMVASAPFAEARRTDQETAREQMKSGQLKPFAEIERNIRNRMKNMEYLGSQFNSRNSTYRFKFLDRNEATKKSRVVQVDVDARTGAVLNIS